MQQRSPHPIDPSRRELIARGVSLTALVALGGPARAQDRTVAQPAGEDLLDTALERLHARLPETNLHRSNHVPMVIETLATLGRPEAILPWYEGNVGQPGTPLEARAPIDRANWREALSRPERFVDWQSLFLEELQHDDWKTVVGRWAPRLVPGLAGAATHGVIRTAHAARAVGRRDNVIRRRELATGLAYWAATYQELPWDGTIAPEASVEAALARVQTRRPTVDPPRGNIIAGLTSLDDTPSFRPVAGLVDTRDPAQTLHEITRAFGQLFLRNPERQIVFTHSITAPSSLRLLLPAIDEETARSATRHAWQAAAGLYVVYGDPRRAAVEPRDTRTRDDLVNGAVEVADAHAIKLTEACLREDAVTPAAIFHATAQAILDAMAG